MREVTLRLRHHGEPESDISERYPDITLESASSLTGSAAERKRIIEITGPADSIEGFLDDFEAADPVLDVTPLTSFDAARVAVAITYDSYQWDSISQRLSDMGIHHRTGTTITAGWERWTVYVEDGDDVSEIIESLERAGNDAELVRDVALSELDGQSHLELFEILEDELTPRQLEVLKTAIDRGYYRPKTDVTIEDISDAVGIAPTTTWEHLAQAEHKVMDQIGEYLL
ncbi:helix-turn-helix domain-containing protein [Halorussus sp. MSC15.2]|uniref:helix-turn-helix domain-containing protein n=1 Tax=Halorussus sp. MSC15.2 TaxID=2283638 RepID=UPI0013D3D9EC|nr:helix-turn-helix domain-containing protein [Halorussus sp. MSC15.2]NEU58813.1 helix-turn-helix domain-containing protein [Halorussus sp. MSC15.2]